MLAYKVGGTVRDALLGRSRSDDDYVVVGATEEDMTERGYRKVGADFPVFIHPETGAEYALARTERKRGRGHKGFVATFDPSVTLEEDLVRRDFTVNAMALDGKGALHDPHLGRRDISLRVLRHVSGAFTEDPLRVLRAARLAAQLGFAVAPETMELMRQMAGSGELDHLVAERVWREVSLGLRSRNPALMVEILRECGALARVLPEVDALFGVPQDPVSHPEGCAGTHTLLVLSVAARNWCGLDVRLAALLHDVGKALTPKDRLPHHPGHEETGERLAAEACDRLRVPKAVARSVQAATREHGRVHGFDRLEAGEVVDLLARVDAFRNPRRLECLLHLCDCDHAANPDLSDFDLHPNRSLVQECRAAASSESVSKAGREAKDPAAAVRRARIEEVGRALEARRD